MYVHASPPLHNVCVVCGEDRLNVVVVVLKRHFFHMPNMPNRKRATVSAENPHFMLSPSFNQMESGSAVTRTVQSSSPILTHTSALGIKIPCSKSDLSAILASGRQVTSQVVSQSNQN